MRTWYSTIIVWIPAIFVICRALKLNEEGVKVGLKRVDDYFLRKVLLLGYKIREIRQLKYERHVTLCITDKCGVCMWP